MGMSASQMRYCMLAGRKSDVEFQGQQINQQRTTLATETAAYNNSLLNLTVPTPPSSDGYVTTSYSYNSNGTKYTITGTNYDAATGTYTVNSTYQTTGDEAISGLSTFYQNTTNGIYYASTGASSGGTALSVVNLTATDETSLEYQSNLQTIFGSNYNGTQYNVGNSSLSQIDLTATTASVNASKSALSTIYGANYDSNPAVRYYQYTSGGTTYYTSSTELAGLAVGTTGNVNVNHLDGTVAAGYVATTASTTASAPSYYEYEVNGTIRYITGSELTNAVTNNEQGTYYYVDTDADITKSTSISGATINWSTSGRMESITTADGTEFSLSVVSSSDDSAYEDAYNEYEYQKGVYEQSISNINAQIDVIESEDKKLELKLQDLDTQQQALSTEMDSVKKVIDKNIESSFKAFA